MPALEAIAFRRRPARTRGLSQEEVLCRIVLIDAVNLRCCCSVEWPDEPEGIHPVLTVANLLGGDQISLPQDFPVAIAEYAARLHFGLGNVDAERVERDESANIHCDRTCPKLHTNVSARSSPVNFVERYDTACPGTGRGTKANAQANAQHKNATDDR